jgi:RsiW-degrading membrane proteinase PrsW (M82 family)/ribosomal protein L40E
VQAILVVLIAFAPGIFWLWMVYRRDSYRPEPRRLVVRTFIWGAVVAIPVAAVESILVLLFDPAAFGNALTGEMALGTVVYMSFVVAGATEELGKFLVVRRTVYGSPYFDEPMDGLVYASAAALGFASLENLGYVLTFGWEIIFLRGLFSTVAHVLFSAMWGYPLGVNKVKPHGARGRVWLGLILAMIAHGLFDFLLFTQDLWSIAAIPFFFASGAVFLLLLRRARRLSPYREMVAPLLVTCPQCGAKLPHYADFCTVCGAGLADAKGTGAVRCGRCGADLNPEAEFCTACGSRLTR